MSNGKDTIIRLITGQTEYFQEPKSSGGGVKFELDLFNYATKVG